MQDENWNMFKHLLQTWTVAYERAILKHHTDLSKKVIDEACHEAVNDWTQRLYNTQRISEIRGKEFQTITDCVNHHIDNLIAGSMWSEKDRPILHEQADPTIVQVTVSQCNYKEGCSWHLQEMHFNNIERFPCQRVGCFAGSVIKYMREEELSERENVDYFMTKVHTEAGCTAILFISKGFIRKKLLTEYLPNKYQVQEEQNG